MIIRQHRITPEDCRSNPDRLYAFGDNMQRWGKAGQACIRDEPNAVGIPTKWAPRREPGAYFSDLDWDNDTAMNAIDEALNRLAAHSKTGGVIVIPNDGIGTGLADLPKRAPKMYRYICGRLQDMASEGRG